MGIPGFTAEASVGRPSQSFRTRWPRGASAGNPSVVAQLKGGGFRPRLGGFGTLGDYWTCKDSCYRTYHACLAGCEGTLGSPKGSTNCIICDDAYRQCVANCAGDIA